MNRTELEKQFKEECTLINMDHEYPGHHETIKWIIITDCSRAELETKYVEVLKKYSPYEVCPASAKEAISEFKRNEDKFKKRQMRNTSIFDLDETVDAWCPAAPSFIDEQEQQEEEEKERHKRSQLVREALSSLTDNQRRRLLLHHVKGLTVTQIAYMEGLKDHTSIVKSIASGEKRFKKFFEKTPHLGTPLSKYSEGVISMSGLISSSTSSKG